MESRGRLTLDWWAIGLCLGVEIGSTVESLPSSLATTQDRRTGTLAMFLHQQPAHAGFAPICCKSGWGMQIEQPDTFPTLPDYLLLGLFESSLKFFAPVERYLGPEQLTEREHCLGDGKGVGDLVHGPKPGPDIR